MWTTWKKCDEDHKPGAAVFYSGARLMRYSIATAADDCDCIYRLHISYISYILEVRGDEDDGRY